MIVQKSRNNNKKLGSLFFSLHYLRMLQPKVKVFCWNVFWFFFKIKISLIYYCIRICTSPIKLSIPYVGVKKIEETWISWEYFHTSFISSVLITFEKKICTYFSQLSSFIFCFFDFFSLFPSKHLTSICRPILPPGIRIWLDLNLHFLTMLQQVTCITFLPEWFFKRFLTVF